MWHSQGNINANEKKNGINCETILTKWLTEQWLRETAKRDNIKNCKSQEIMEAHEHTQSGWIRHIQEDIRLIAQGNRPKTVINDFNVYRWYFSAISQLLFPPSYVLLYQRYNNISGSRKKGLKAKGIIKMLGSQREIYAAMSNTKLYIHV